MTDHHVLFVGSRDRCPAELTSMIERDSKNRIGAEATFAVQKALTLLSEKGYDVVVCWVEGEHELAGVIRIRKANPQLPILVMTSQEAPDFHDLARRMGATKVSRCERDLSVVAERIRLSVQSGELLEELRSQTQRVRANAVEVRKLAKQNRELGQSAWNQIKGSGSKTHFVPLLVEDDPDQAELMIRAFQKADIRAPLTVLRTGEEAIAFLAGSAPFENRNRYPLPTLLILDCNLPGNSGLDVLEWKRTQPRLDHVPVVMLSSSSDPHQVSRAYNLGAKSYIVKPPGFKALVEIVSSLDRQWGTPSPGV